MMNRSQKFFLCSCELFIEHFKIPYPGYLYLIWASGKKQTQSLKYQTNSSKSIEVNETLTLNLKLHYRAGKYIAKSTSLFLLNQLEEELDDIELEVNEWTNQFKEVNLPIGGGTLTARVRRKQIMEVNNIQSDEEEYVEVEEVHHRKRTNSKTRRRSIGKRVDAEHQFQYAQKSAERSFFRADKSMLSQTNMVQSNSAQELNEINQELTEELAKTKKQLEDNIYLNNKLKNDRDILLRKAQDLENQIDGLLVKMSQDVQTLREHYERRLVIRQNIYQEDIEEMILLVNSNSDYNRKVLEQVSRQKLKLEDEVKALLLDNQAKEAKIEQYISKYESELKNMNEELARKFSEHEQQKAEQLKRIEEEMEVKRKQMEHIRLSVYKQKEDMEKELEVYKAEFEKSRINNQSLEDEVNEYNRKIDEKSQQLNGKMREISSKEEELHNKTLQIHEKTMEVDKATANVRKLSEMLEVEQAKSAGLAKELEEMTAKVAEFGEKDKEELLNTKQQLQQLTFELEFNEDVLKQLKEQHAEKERQLYTQLQNIQSIYNDKLEECLNKLNLKIQTLHNENNELRQKLDLSERQLSDYHSQLEKESEMVGIKGSQLEVKDGEVKRLESEKDKLSEELSQLRQKGGEFGAMNQKLQQEVNRLKKQLQNQRQKVLECEREIQEMIELAKDPSIQVARTGLLNKSMHMSRMGSDASDSKHIIPKNDISRRDISRHDISRHDISRHDISRHDLSRREPSRRDISRHDISRHDISMGPIDTNQLENQLARKDDRIYQLEMKIQELYGLCSSLEAKIDLIVQKYPNIDLKAIEAGTSLNGISSAKIEQYCESQKEEEIDINADQEKKAKIIEELDKSQQLNKEQLGSSRMRNKGELSRLKSMDIIPGAGNPLSPIASKKDPNFQNSFLVKKESFLQHRDSMGMSRDLSEHSNSYVKVSHKQKIKELQSIIQDFEEREMDYQKEIEAYLKTITELTSQIEKMKKDLEEYMQKPQIGEETLSQLETFKSQHAILESQLTEKNREIESVQNQIQTLRNSKLALEERLKQLEKENAVQKEKIMVLEIKGTDSLKKLGEAEESLKKTLAEVQLLQKRVIDLEQKVRDAKQVEQESRLQNRELIIINEQTTNEMKKFKALAEEYEEKVRKNAGTEVLLRELQKEVEDWNKKNLDQLRQFNHLKLEKDSSDEEMKLVKKRYSEQTRVAIEWEEKAASLERTIDDQKRKESKLKREVEDAQEEVRKSKSAAKKLEEEMHTLQTLQSSFLYEKKKATDEISQLQDQITRKEYDCNRLLKELEKYRHRIEENDDVRLGKKNQLRQEIQKLESELIKKEKRTVEDFEEIKMLKGRLQFLEKENRKIMEQKNQTYGEKLRHYIDEIASIKKLLDQYQSENSKLKLQNNEFFEDNEMLKLALSKLENKYEQNIQNEENILTDLQHYIDELAASNDKNRAYESQLNRLEQTYAQASKQLEGERASHKKKTQKLETLQRAHQRLQQELKDLKVRYSELETDAKIGYNLSEKYKNLDRKKAELEEQYKHLKEEYDNVVRVFVFKKEDMEKAVSDVRSHERKNKETEISARVEELTAALNNKSARFEAELLEMYNQNSKIREELQSKTEEIAKLKLRIAELQPLSQRIAQLENDRLSLEEELSLSKDEVKRRNEKITRDEVYILELERGAENKQNELMESLNRVNELEMKIERLTDKIAEWQEKEASAQEKLRELVAKEKQRAEEQINQNSKSSQQQESFEMKLFQAQLELAKLREKEQKQAEDYSSKVKHLEAKIEEMADTMKEHEKALEAHYEQELMKSEENLVKLSEELEDKLQRIDELNEALIILQHENEEMDKELSAVRYKLDEETEIFNIEYGKLKAKLKESEDIYNANLKNLEEELSSMGRELAAAKHSQHEGNSRLRSSEIEEGKKAVRRLEEKAKSKDKKIEELKSNIYILEQTVLKLRKKESGAESLQQELQEWKTQHSRLQSSNAELQTQLQRETSVLQETIRTLKQSLILAKDKEDKAVIQLEEKMMEYTSMQSELKTTKDLYTELQKEIDRRKVNIANQIEQESGLAMELRLSQSKLQETEAVYEQVKKLNDQLTAEVKQKQQENKRLLEQIEKVKLDYEKNLQMAVQTQGHQASLKNELEQVKTQRSVFQAESRSLKSELSRLKKANEDLKTEISLNQSQIEEVNMTIQSMNSRLREHQSIVHSYKTMEDIIKQDLGIGLEQMIQGKYWQEMLDQKEAEVNQLIEEVEELKFLSDRKLLDYDELKRENYELGLKADDNEILTEQVENLRRICDKLEDEKKSAIFKEELLKMQLSNMAETYENQSIRAKIEGILRSCSNTSGIAFGQSSFGNY